MHLPFCFLIFLVYGAGALAGTLNSLGVSFVASTMRLTSREASRTFLLRPGRSPHELAHRTQTHRTSAGYLTSPSSEAKVDEDCRNHLGSLEPVRIDLSKFALSDTKIASYDWLLEEKHVLRMGSSPDSFYLALTRLTTGGLTFFSTR